MLVAGDYRAPASRRVALVRQVPPPPADFTGREEELRQLRAALADDKSELLAILGMGGTGKTALTLKLAEQVKDGYQDAQIYLDLRGAAKQKPLTSEEAMLYVLRALYPGVEQPADPAEISGAYRSSLDGQQVLLLYDNAADSAQLKPLIPPKGCLMLVTSRQQIVMPSIFTVPLKDMPPEDARRLLLGIASRIGEQADEIAVLCGYLPFALRLAGSALAERPDLTPTEYIQRLKDKTQRLELIASSISLSYDLLSDDLRRFWNLLAVFEGSFQRKAAAAVWDLDSDQTAEHLGELLKLSLIEWDPEAKRYQLHDLAALFAEEKLEPDEERIGRHRHATYNAHELSAIDDLFNQGGQSIETSLDQLESEWPNIVAAQAWVAGQAVSQDQPDRLAAEFPVAGASILSLGQYRTTWIDWLVTGVKIAQRLEEPAMERTLTKHLGNAYVLSRKPDEAIHMATRLLELADEELDQVTELAALNVLGSAHDQLGEYEQAIKFLNEALKKAPEVDPDAFPNILGNRGLTYRKMGMVDWAVKSFERQLELTREMGDREGEAKALANLGSTFGQIGETAAAIEHREKALTIFRALRDPGDQARELYGLGYLYHYSNHPKKAADSLEELLMLLPVLEDQALEAATRKALGNIYADLGEPEKAEKSLERALAILRRLGHRERESDVLSNLASLHADLGHDELALKFFDESLEVARSTGKPLSVLTPLLNFGIYLTATGKHQQGLQHLLEALQIAQKKRQSRFEAILNWNVSEAYEQSGDLEKAIEHLKAAQKGYDEQGDPLADRAAAQLEVLHARLKGPSSG